MSQQSLKNYQTLKICSEVDGLCASGRNSPLVRVYTPAPHGYQATLTFTNSASPGIACGPLYYSHSTLRLIILLNFLANQSNNAENKRCSSRVSKTTTTIKSDQKTTDTAHFYTSAWYLSHSWILLPV